MKAAFINEYGSFDKVVIGEMAMPIITEHEILVEMKAASINPIDWKIVKGGLKFLTKPQFPLILGSDGAGIIVDIGSKVSNFKLGDEVFFRCDKNNIGTYAEYLAIPEELTALKPKNMNFEEAASIPLVGLTTYQALIEKGGLTKNQKILIHAGAGGVGTFAIQFAKAHGAHVATTASRKRNELLKDLGADQIIDYRTQQIENELSDIDIVYNTLGDSVLTSSYQTLNPEGVVVNILGMPDPESIAKYTSNPIPKWASQCIHWIKQKKASKYNAVYKHHLMYANGKQLGEIAKLIEANKIRAVIDSTYPLEKIKEAFKHSENGHTQGKIIITFN